MTKAGEAPPVAVVHVGYSKAAAAVMLALGLLQLVLGLLTAQGSALAIRLIPAGVCLLVGILYSFRPYFELRPAERQLVVPAALGPAKKVYSFARTGDVRVDGSVLWVGGQKTAIRSWLADAGGWALLVEHLRRESLRAE